MYPKAQHYVPQFYLRNFANKRKKGFFVACFDKFTGKVFKPNVKNVANQTAFYDFIASNGEELSLEAAFSDIETRAQVAIRAQIEDPTASRLRENSQDLANFFALQECRTPVLRDLEEEMIRGANTRLAKDGIAFEIPTEDEAKEFQARFLMETTRAFAEAMRSLKWVLIRNATSKPFWTSDNPIFRYNPRQSDPAGNLGLMSTGIQLYVPIAPQLAVVICDPVEYAGVDPEIFAEPANVDFNNSGQVLGSRRYIFSIDDDFSLAQKMIDENPDLSKPDRQRVIVN